MTTEQYTPLNLPEDVQRKRFEMLAAMLNVKQNCGADAFDAILADQGVATMYEIHAANYQSVIDTCEALVAAANHVPS